jgi:hypothetical protein
MAAKSRSGGFILHTQSADEPDERFAKKDIT